MGNVVVITPQDAERMSTRRFGPERALPYLLNRRILGPTDEVLQQFGGWDGIGIYAQMLRQHGWLYGIVKQLVDNASKIERVLVAGDPNDPMSLELLRQANLWWRNLPAKEVLIEKLGFAKYYGFTPIEKVWGRCSASNLLAPVATFDQPQQNIRFGPNGEEYFITYNSPVAGELIDPGVFFYLRWGSSYSPYGEGVAKYVYHIQYLYSVIQESGMLALEELSKPIPQITYPAGWQKDRVDELEERVSSNHRYYLLIPGDVDKPETTFPGLAAAAQGGHAGRGELEWMRYLEGLAYIVVLGAQQTQDKTGGSRALEESRLGITDAKTRQLSAAIDEGLTDGLLKDIGAANWSGQPQQLWPYFDSDRVEIESGITGIAASNAMDTMLRLKAGHITRRVAEDQLISLGYPQSRAARMVQSTIDEMAALTVAPEMVSGAPLRSALPPPQPSQDGTP